MEIVRPAALAVASPQAIEVRLVGIRYAARDTHLFDLARADGGVMPTAEPGAHVDLRLPNGVIRQYSLTRCEPAPTSYTLGIKRDEGGRGGSRLIFDAVRVGHLLTISAPRNNFPLVEAGHVMLFRRRHWRHPDPVDGPAAGLAKTLIRVALLRPIARGHGVRRRTCRHAKRAFAL